MLFFLDVKQYVPVKLCKSAGSIHLFQLYGQHSLLLHVMLRQGTSWYALDKTDSELLLPPPLQESEI